MSTTITSPLRPDPAAASPDEPVSDARLIAGVGAALAIPRRDAADSFVLHAPLELAARAALLSWVRPAARPGARRRLQAIADEFVAFGPPVDPAPAVAFPSLAAGAARLAVALDRGELDDIDSAATWLGVHAGPDDLRALLADAVLPRLGAAAHAPIFLYQAPRVGPRGELDGGLLRGLARELGREPTWRLHWIDASFPADRPAGPAALFEALQATPNLGIPGSLFIQPLMAQVDDRGIAGALLAPAIGAPDLATATRTILRAAALSMLQEPSDHAAYGWSHCLTMPQAVLGIAAACSDPRRAVAVAATYVVGFRAALARRPLDAAYAPERPSLTWRDALDTAPPVAAAAVWHAPATDLAALTSTLATRAALHRDAHLAKYTLACVDAAAADPEQRRLYLAAAASLSAWWSQQPDDPTDPLRDWRPPPDEPR